MIDNICKSIFFASFLVIALCFFFLIALQTNDITMGSNRSRNESEINRQNQYKKLSKIKSALILWRAKEQCNIISPLEAPMLFSPTVLHVHIKRDSTLEEY